MKKSLWIAATLMCTQLVAWEDDWSLNNYLSFWGDLAYYRRSEGGRHTLISKKKKRKHHDRNQPDNLIKPKPRFEHCTGKNLVTRFRYEPGFQAGAAYLTRHTSLEANYLWISPWMSSCHRLDPHHRSIFFSRKHQRYFHGFSKARSAAAHYDSRFQNGELNFFRYMTPRKGDYFSAAWMVGLRYVHLHEDLDLSFHRTKKHRSVYDITVSDQIGVAQAGLSVIWNPTWYLSWDLRLKAGPGCAWNKQRTFMGNHHRHLLDFKKSELSAVLMTDASLSLTYQPWRYINLHAAYQVLFLDNIALAPDQIIQHPHPKHRIRTNGHAVIHGATGGISVSF